LNFNLIGYSLGSSCCCQNLQKGGVCNFVTEDLSFNKIDILLYCAEQTSEVCAVELETESSHVRILALYRAPSANSN